MRTPLLCLAIAFTLGASAQLPGYVPTSGLVAWYPLNNSVVDASGNGLNGTANYTQAAVDRFAVPNGATDFFFAYASVSTSPLFNTGAGMTVSAWVNLSDPFENQKVMGRVNYSFNSGFILGVENGQLHPEVWNSAGEAHAFSAGNIPSNTWTHVAITWATNGSLVAYVNGVAADSIPAGSLPIGSNSEPLVIGCSPWSVSPMYFPVSGGLDDIGIWSRALSPSEVMNVYSSLTTGVASVEAPSAFSLYPNPAETTVSIRVSADRAGGRYSVLDAVGRTVAQGTLGNGVTSVAVDGLPTGVYTIRVGGAMPAAMQFVKR